MLWRAPVSVLGDGASLLPGRISPHPAQPLLAFGEHGVIELPACFQMRAQAGRLTLVDLEGQFQQKGRRAFLCRLALLCRGLALLAHASLLCCLLFLELLF